MRRAVQQHALRAALHLLLSVVVLELTGASASAATPLELVTAHFQQHNATTRLLARDFLFEGQALVQSFRFKANGCWAVFAWGGSGLRDVDVGLYSSAGQLLAEDRGATPYSYARVCAAQGVPMYVSAQAFAGRGELTLFLVENAPRELGRLPDALPVAVSQGGRVSPPRDIGGEEVEMSFEAPALYEERAMVAVGYTAIGQANVLEMRAGVAQGALLLRGGRCYRLLAFSPTARGIIVEVESGLLRREVRSPDAELLRVPLCTLEEGLHTVRVRTRAARSVALVRVFEQPLATPDDASKFGEERALLLGEARALAEQRGMTLKHLGEVWVEGGGSVIWPLPEEPGCQMLLGLPERGVDVELRVVNADGVWLSSNEGRRGVPSVFVCPERAQRLRLMVKGRGAAGPVSLWRARGTQ